MLTSITLLFFFILLFCILHVALKGCMQLHTPTFICHNKPPWCYVTGQIKTYMEMNMYTCKYFLLFCFFFNCNYICVTYHQAYDWTRVYYKFKYLFYEWNHGVNSSILETVTYISNNYPTEFIRGKLALSTIYG